MTGLRRRRLGVSGPEVSIIGLGAMGMSDLYGPADEAESVATLHAAIDAGVNLIDTGDFYGSGHNEMLIGRVLRERRREDVVVSVKFGARRTPDGGFQAAPYDVSAAAVKDRLAYSLRRLGTDYIDIYRPSRLNPQVPVEETVGALREMQEAGYIRHIGLSEVSADTIRRAAAVAPISDLQIEYSLLSRGPEATILPALRELGIGLTAYGVLSRGLLSGHWSADRALTGGDFRANSPRFQGEHLTANLRLVDALGRVAQRLGATTSQVAIAWVAAQGEQIVPLVGARRRERLTESLAAIDLVLDREALDEIERAVPAGAASGERYATAMMANLDSEK
ncbi:aldo/keto reductase [Micromonospora parathelypteridis]|uniref:Aryl-alcohol dehydrogenase-like predicted oxidoreductase n=1 Tax=Micromonospora parathelypteridis TaxID=1839617 RepID=A0A840VGT8_9ACTN|nr:aldo/keto reductase [Micromonospora parathelypteridis]MBB5476013.1 aryl-alcohol dehydrogenase-like predicted oxidoreductase [Micromonospora parathelypteridis]GGO32415.1 aldo/keto reductase [Micromonospora parathelypteridis]